MTSKVNQRPFEAHLRILSFFVFSHTRRDCCGYIGRSLAFSQRLLHITTKISGLSQHNIESTLAFFRLLAEAVVETLLKNGGDPKMANNEGSTPLHHACQFGRT